MSEPDHLLGKPGIVLTLYGDPAALRQLAETLAAQHAWSPHPRKPDVWLSTDEDLRALLIKTPTDGDTAGLQINYNVSDASADDGWPAVRRRLAHLLGER